MWKKPTRVKHTHSLCPTVSQKGETSNIVFNPGSLHLRLRLAHPRNFRPGVNNRRNGIVVDVTVSARNVLHGRDTLFLGLVRQHGSCNNVADGADAWYVGFELFVDLDASFLVDLDADGFEVEAFGEGAAANGDEDDVYFELLRWGYMKINAIVGALDKVFLLTD